MTTENHIQKQVVRPIVNTKFGKQDVYNPENDIDYATFRTVWGFITNITFANKMTVCINTTPHDYFEERTVLKVGLTRKQVSQSFKKHREKHNIEPKCDPHDQNRQYYPYDETAKFIKKFMENFCQQVKMKHQAENTKVSKESPDIDDDSQPNE